MFFKVLYTQRLFLSGSSIHYLNLRLHCFTALSSLHVTPSLSLLSPRLPSSNSECLSEGLPCPFPPSPSLFPFPATPTQHHNSSDPTGSARMSYHCNGANLVMHGWAPCPISITRAAVVNCAAAEGRSLGPVKYTSPQVSDGTSRQLNLQRLIPGPAHLWSETQQ